MSKLTASQQSFCLLLICLLIVADTIVLHDREFWYEEARSVIRKRLADSDVLRGQRVSAKNVILLVGDGMGVSTLTAARIFKGQRLGQSGEEHYLAWDEFPALALAKTYNLDGQIGESSACATALVCGVKARLETVGLDAGGRFQNCTSSLLARVDSLVDWAQSQGKATGIVTNSRITHATPAALYGHAASRYWEDDGKVPPPARKSCKDIARQLVEDDPGRHVNVLLGGGRRHWLPKVAKDPELVAEEGRRLDGRNLIDDWVRDKKRRNLRGEYVWNKEQMDKVDPAKTDHLLGLFAYSHMDFEADRDDKTDPSLAEMTKKALDFLLKNPRGFFLFVESGRIDHAHHYNNPYRALDETLVLESALLVVLSLVNLSETLIVVTSDHSNVMTLGGLSTPRGNPILGMDTKNSDIDGNAYSTILYGNGPGYSAPRAVPTNTTAEKNAVHSSAVPRQWATHGGEDVPVYARGPLASVLFSGTVDQSYIPHAIAYIACLGEYSQRCVENQTRPLQTCGPPEVSGVTSASGRSKDSPAVVLASSEMSDSGASHAIQTYQYSSVKAFNYFLQYVALLTFTAFIHYEIT
ncbi:alkaline phosphatase, tissue-nonspecific isozyme [Nilaparvata lugens]|uniref:alkaline phosphatase n=1 Tax=Nilaparvata lugens TaxID=108931 RepID=A0A2L1IQ98_NILLU|nr:alkaline phosphatase, tissue-nonspecific isozyme [Nilaparvata lugens]AVD96952.1 ALP-3 [Nilaparvata lugens]